MAEIAQQDAMKSLEARETELERPNIIPHCVMSAVIENLHRKQKDGES